MSQPKIEALKKKRSWIETSDSKDWVAATIKRLKTEYVVDAPLKLLKELPYDQARDMRIDAALTQIVKMEVDQMTADDVKTYQEKVNTHLDYTALKVLVYDVTMPGNVETMIRNIAWSGPYTYGCSFGHDVWRVFDSQDGEGNDKRPIAVESMRAETKEQFWALLETTRGQNRGQFASAASFHKLENDDENDLYEEGDLYVYVEEIMRIGRIIERHKCTCEYGAKP